MTEDALDRCAGRGQGHLYQEKESAMNDTLIQDHEARNRTIEITVTPEMIEVGAELLMDFEWADGCPNTYAENIFRAMTLASHRGGESDLGLAH